MRIGKRLMAVMKMVDNGSSPVDIGTDHAYLPICLVQNGISKTVLAVDNKEEPLRHAEKMIKKYHNEDRILVSFSDGLKGVINYPYDTIIIAGLGGDTIDDILTGSKIRPGTTIILEPNTHQKEVRETLVKLHYQIIDEEMVKDREYYYTVIKAIPMVNEITYTDKELFFGPVILKKNPPELKELILHNIKLLEFGLSVSENQKPIRDKIAFFREAYNALK